jgi:uncharacterized membrane protein YkvA (DUF1232 family)
VKLIRTGRVKKQIGNVGRDLAVLRLALKDPRTPWYAKALVGLVVFYALSPIDLIPDFVPMIGQLDDLIVVPLGLKLASKLVPKPLMEEYTRQAILIEQGKVKKPMNRRLIAIVVLVLALCLAVLAWKLGWLQFSPAKAG